MRYLRRFVLGVMLVCQVWCGAAENPFNVDCFLGWGGSYRPGTWTPLEIGITSTLTEPFEGQVVITAAQDGTHRMEIRQPFVLTPGLPVNMPLVTKIAFGAEQLKLRVTNAKGRTRYEQDITLWDFSDRSMYLMPVNQEDLFIGVVGRSQQFGLLSLTKDVKYTNRQNTRNSGNRQATGSVVVQSKLPRMVPWDWTGFAGLDLLVLYDPDWSRFRAEQIRGMTEWVMQGGRILILLGAQGLPNNALFEALPMRVGTLQEKALTSDWLRQWGLSDEEETLAVAYGVSGDTERADTLFAVESLGFGRVGVMGVDPQTLGDHQRAHSTAFWMELLSRMLENGGRGTGDASASRLVGRAALTPVVGHAVTRDSGRLLNVSDRQSQDRPDRDFYNYAQGVEQQSTGRILDYLYGIDEMRPLSIGWVVLLLALLAVLLGPVDYMVLKRLDRLPLTWVTSLGWILLFTVGAYYGVQALRAGDMQLRTVSLVDAVQDEGMAWNTRVCGLFAPKSDEYQLDQLTPGQWWSAVAASRSHWSSFQARSARRTLHCRQINGANWPFAVPINIWTMQTLTSESRQDSVPVRARVLTDDDQVTVEVTNQSAGTISNGMVVFGSGRGIPVDRVGPGETRSFQGTLKPTRAWPRIATQAKRGQVHSLDPVDVFTLNGTQGRSQGIQNHLNNGAAVLCVQYDEDEPAPFTVKNKGTCKYHHVQLARLVVYPQKRKSL